MTAATAPVGVTQARVLTSEWIKLRSLRSTWFGFAAAMVLSIGLGALISGIRGHDYIRHGFPPGQFAAVETSLRGIYLAQLAVGVLGVLLITGEYATGMIKASLTAVPRRVPVLAAKVLVFGTFTFVLSTIMCLLAFFAGQAALSGNNLDVSLGSPGALRAVLGGAVFLTAVGLMGLGLGFVLRNTGGAIAGLFAIVLVLPLIAQALPQSWQDHINKYLALDILNAVISRHRDATALSPGAGMAVLVAYAGVVLGAGLFVLLSRDA